MKTRPRKHLSIPGLLDRARAQYKKIVDPLAGKTQFSLPDCLMSGLALFAIKYPSLLQFDEDTRDEARLICHNLRTLYKVERAPSDTYFRERLDGVEPYELQRVINRIIAQLQRGKVLEQYRYMVDDYYLVAIDASGYFSSHEVHCSSCCIKHHRDGTVTYYHQMLAAVLVHPDKHCVFPLALEPIVKQDGAKKNDCEHNAVKRLLRNLRNAHPHLKLLVTLDGLYADGVILELLEELDIRYIITAKRDDLKHMYEFYDFAKKSMLTQETEKIKLRYEWVSSLPINDTHHHREVNLLTLEEDVLKKSAIKKQKFAWITDLPLTPKTVPLIAKGGRARWHIENETFNTLKNQGYQFDRNFGHGQKNLSVVLAYLMFTAFLIDQVQEYCCKYFQAALKKSKRLIRLWQTIRAFFLYSVIDSWEQFYTAIIDSHRMRLTPWTDTS
jgi:hypothetical protein